VFEPCESTLILTHIKIIRKYAGPSHHAMARPGVANGGDGLQIRMVAANIRNKQSRQPTRSGPPAWGFREGLTTPHPKNRLVTKFHTGPRIWHGWERGEMHIIFWLENVK
jgi:hypothetical protein